jgi:CHAT domain-containing protein/tetratricopeptide (TPR) repeat protein
MNRLQRYFAIVATSLVLACCFVSPLIAQLRGAEKLDEQITRLKEAGKYAEAIPLAKRELALYEKALGPDDPKVADALSNLAELYFNQRRYADAELLYKRALAIREKTLGPEDPYVGLTLANLADTYEAEGRLADAESLYERALAIEEKEFGPGDANVTPLVERLAETYRGEGRYTEAEPLEKRLLAAYERAFGSDDVRVGGTLNDLAALYRLEGRYAEAEALYKRALAIEEKAGGPDDSNVGAVLNGLAILYTRQGRYADAELLYKRALAIGEKAYGPNHVVVGFALVNLATVYVTAKRYADAEPLYTRAVAILKKEPNPARVAEPLGELAELYRNQGRYAEAEPLAKQSLEIYEKTLGPNHPSTALPLNILAELSHDQGHYAEAEPFYKRALAIRESALGPNHPDVALSLNNLAMLYNDQHRYEDALLLVQRTIAQKTATTAAALPVLYGAEAATLIATDEVMDESLNVIERASQTSASEALNALAVRFAAGNSRLAELVRKDQDLAGEAAALDKAILASVASNSSGQNSTTEQNIRDRIAAIAKEREELGNVFAREFPDYAALSKPEPLTVKNIQPLLAEDEALVIVNLGEKKSYVWAITRSEASWKELALTAEEVSKSVSTLRGLLDFYNARPFDAQASFALYQKILAPVEDLLRAKPRLSLVLDGALTSLPPQLLVTRDPTGKPLKDVDWLVRSHAVTVLPSVASLKVLRGKSAVAGATKPLIGFADPVFDRDPQRLLQNPRVAANVTASRGIRGTVADIAELRTALPPLPETAPELRDVAASVKATPADIILGADATESRVKQEKLDQYRIVYFATHGLLAGDVADFAKLKAEPALVLSLPETPTEFDDGLLTASEVAQLKLNADWVVLSACNTAAAEKPGALSGLARAFFYAGGRSLLVSNWEVETTSAVALMVGTFAALAADPKLSHAEALQKAMLAVIENTQHSEWADPKYWAPFVVVGEPAKQAN